MARSAGVVGTDDLATFLNLGTRRIQQLVKNDGMPTEGRGRFDVLKCAAWYIRYLQKSVERRGADVTAAEAYRTHRARVTDAEATLREMEVAKARRELIPVEDAARLWEEALAKLRAKALGSVTTAAVQCVGLRSLPQAHAVLERVIHEALREVSGVGAEVRGPSRNGHGDSGAS